jgi:hypothetical protein
MAAQLTASHERLSSIENCNGESNYYLPSLHHSPLSSYLYLLVLPRYLYLLCVVLIPYSVLLDVFAYPIVAPLHQEWQRIVWASPLRYQ